MININIVHGKPMWFIVVSAPQVRHFRGNQLVAAGAFQNWKAVAETEHQTRQLCRVLGGNLSLAVHNARSFHYCFKPLWSWFESDFFGKADYIKHYKTVRGRTEAVSQQIDTWIARGINGVL